MVTRDLIYDNPTQAVSLRVSLLNSISDRLLVLSVNQSTIGFINALSKCAILAANILDTTNGSPVGDQNNKTLDIIELLASAGANGYVSLAKNEIEASVKVTFMELGQLLRNQYLHIHNTREQSYKLFSTIESLNEIFVVQDLPIKVTQAAISLSRNLLIDVLAIDNTDIEVKLNSIATGITIVNTDI